MSSSPLRKKGVPTLRSLYTFLKMIVLICKPEGEHQNSDESGKGQEKHRRVASVPSC